MNEKVSAPVVIKRKKILSSGGHHGGAWKVAYADFVTAMMAFFMLMWLLNATTEKQRKGLADYFDPTIPIVRISGGGNGAFSGDTVFSNEKLVNSGVTNEDNVFGGENNENRVDIEIEKIEKSLGALSDALDTAGLFQDHIYTKVTDEGLVVTIHDSTNNSLFRNQDLVANDVLINIVAIIAEVFNLSLNEIAVAGHVRVQPIVLLKNRNWMISTERAHVVRRLLEESGINPQRISRVAGWSDRRPNEKTNSDIRDNRIEIILLR